MRRRAAGLRRQTPGMRSSTSRDVIDWHWAAGDGARARRLASNDLIPVSSNQRTIGATAAEWRRGIAAHSLESRMERRQDSMGVFSGPLAGVLIAAFLASTVEFVEAFTIVL